MHEVHVQRKYQYWRLFLNVLVSCFKQKKQIFIRTFVLKQTHTTNWTGNERINLYRPITADNYSLCQSRFKVDLSRFFPRVMKSTFLQVVDLCRPDEWRHSVKRSQITLGWVTRAVPPLAIGFTLIVYGNRTGKLRVRVYPRVGSGMGRNFRRGSGTGTDSILGYGYGSGSWNGRPAHP